MTVKKIDNDYDFDEEYYAIETLSSLADYQFALLINKEFSCDFRRLANLKVYNQSKKVFEEYSFFEWKRLGEVSYFLIHPFASQDNLMPVFYFFIQSIEREENIGSFVNRIQNLSEVISADSVYIGATEDLPDRFQTASFKKRIQTIHDILYDLENFLRERTALEKQQKKFKIR